MAPSAVVICSAALIPVLARPLGLAVASAVAGKHTRPDDTSPGTTTDAAAGHAFTEPPTRQNHGAEEPTRSRKIEVSEGSLRRYATILHGDIAAGNVLWRAEPVIIDWEYGRLGDPADEIAYTFDQNGLTPPQREAFWRGYQHSTGARGRLVDVADRIDWWERLTLLGSTLWWVERWVRRVESDASGTSDPAVPREQSYYLDHLSRRTDRLEHLLNRAAPGHPTQSDG